ncbi:MAG: hypothetical protein ACLFP1_03120 [Candidatus Goldiibacteriota bacterium]
MKTEKSKAPEKTKRNFLRKKRGQSLFAVLLLGSLLAFLGSSLLYLFQTEIKLLTKYNCMLAKQELAAIAVEHSLYKLQQGSNWFVDDPPGLINYAKEYETDLGYYTVHVASGNLFFTDSSKTERQAKNEYKTIGIKVRSKLPEDDPCTGMYYAVVQRQGYGGPLISKGKINLNCNSNDYEDYQFYWGDIYSSKNDPDACRMPIIPVGQGDDTPQPWKPRVYAKNAIYTAVHATGGRGGSITFDYVYDDMSPTAHSHPFSEFAIAPEIDFEYMKMMAKRNNAYYGPPVIPGYGANPYYINDGEHDISTIQEIAAKTSTDDCDGEPDCSYISSLMSKLDELSSYLFIDTTDGLPLRETSSNSWNTYTGRIAVNSDDGCDGTLRLYCSDDNQYFTSGTLMVMGPLIIMGDDPSDIDDGYGHTYTHGHGTGSDADRISYVLPPDNYYYPQDDDGAHYNFSNGNEKNCYLSNVKHHGILYAGGELHIGGKAFVPGSGRGSGSVYTDSDVCIFGTVYLGDNSELTANTNEDPELHVYYDRNINIFGFMGNSLRVVSFNEWTFLIPDSSGS